ncbi:MAG: tetratricopeptide repeat protein, partial [Candidatus Aminicenantes bacterium]|nr:tetratricopeptide repeat protein [Candidatus Aminicenantes bacterium]
ISSGGNNVRGARRTPALAWVLLACLLVPSAFSGQQEMPDQKYAQAGLWVDAGRYAEALILYEESLKEDGVFDGNKRSRIFNNMGYCHYKLDGLDAAVDNYRQALEIDPNYAFCLNNLAVVLMNQKKYKEALPCLEQANRVEKNIKVVFNLFAVHYYLDQRKEALVFIKEAFRLDEGYTEDRLKKKNVSREDLDRLKKYIRE